MKAPSGFLLAVAAVGLLLLIATSPVGKALQGAGAPAKEHGPIAWLDALDKGQGTATKDKKVVMVDFYADWCGPCLQMLKTTWKDKDVVARSRQFVPVLLNYDKQPLLAKKYSIQSIPLVLFLDAKGKVVQRVAGYQDAKTMLKQMDAVLKQTGGKR